MPSNETTNQRWDYQTTSYNTAGSHWTQGLNCQCYSRARALGLMTAVSLPFSHLPCNIKCSCLYFQLGKMYYSIWMWIACKVILKTFQKSWLSCKVSPICAESTVPVSLPCCQSARMRGITYMTRTFFRYWLCLTCLSLLPHLPLLQTYVSPISCCPLCCSKNWPTCLFG